jgi:hypothetical protein
MFFVAAVVAFVAVLVALGTDCEALALVLFLAMLSFAAWGALRGLVWLDRPSAQTIPNVLGTLGNLAILGLGALFTFIATMSFGRGRQIRRFGRLLLPPVRRGGDWAREPMSASIEDATTRAGLAAQWRENGRTEHASVAAFARLTLDLMVLGAPPALIAAANRDALDEIRHAELCFSLARALDGREESPAAFPGAGQTRGLPGSRALALARLAVDSLVDGALHEGVSARTVARLARRCADPATRAVLKEIAADEGRHSAHGWDVVRWCLAEGGEPVAHALAGAARAIPKRMESQVAVAARDGSWEKWGIPGQELEAAEYEKTRTDVVRRVELLVSGVRRAA